MQLVLQTHTFAWSIKTNPTHTRSNCFWGAPREGNRWKRIWCEKHWPSRQRSAGRCHSWLVCLWPAVWDRQCPLPGTCSTRTAQVWAGAPRVWRLWGGTVKARRKAVGCSEGSRFHWASADSALSSGSTGTLNWASLSSNPERKQEPQAQCCPAAGASSGGKE